MILAEKKISRKVVESYARSKEQKIAFIEDSDISLLGLDQQQDCLRITSKRKMSAWGYSKRQSTYSQEGIGLDAAMRNIVDVSLGDTAIIEKVTPLAREKVTLRPIEEIIPGISTRIAEYIPFALKDNPLIVGEWMWYSFDNITFVFEVLEIQPSNAEAIVVTKDTKFLIEAPQKS